MKIEDKIVLGTGTCIITCKIFPSVSSWIMIFFSFFFNYGPVIGADFKMVLNWPQCIESIDRVFVNII